MFLEIHADTRRKTPYYYGLFRETYRLNGRVQHRTRGRVTGLTQQQLRALRDFVRAGCPDPAGPPACRVLSSREWGACHAVLTVLQDLGLEQVIYSRREDWVRHVLAMIVGRVVYQGSKLSLTNLWQDTALWSLVGLGEDRPDVDPPVTAQKETRTRQALIEKTSKDLQRVANSRKKRTAAALGAAVGKALARWKVGKFFTWQVEGGRLTWSLNTALVEQEQALDGCYVVRTDVSAKLWDRAQAVAAYRSLSLVEQAIRQLKTVSLEIRPTYHHLDKRIKSHVFLCVLAYYVQWHMQQRLEPLFAEDGKGSERRWTFPGVVERLKSIRQERVEIGGTEVQLSTTPDDEQTKLLELLKVAV